MDSSNRTFVSSVLFLDIVEYSKCSVTEQMKLKQRFNALLVKALQHVAVSERIVLDTGDGAAISFLGNPEDALFAAMSLRDGVAVEDQNELPKLAVRLGINLGPVRLIKDINGQLNIIGDGINVAQRIMSFAEPGIILVSRSYYEVVSRLSDDYAQIFQDAGIRTDKHVREHAVYSIGDTSGTIPPVRSSASTHKLEQLFLNRPERRAAKAGEPGVPIAAGGLNKRLVTIVSACAVAIVIGAAAFRISQRPPENVVAETVPAQAEADKTTAASAEKPAAAKVAASKEASPKPVPAKTETAAPAVKPVPEAPTKATVNLVVLPWGEVFVDGKSRGVSPPIKSVSLAPGKHTIEIKNTTFPTYTETVEAKAGATIKIRHKF